MTLKSTNYTRCLLIGGVLWVNVLSDSTSAENIFLNMFSSLSGVLCVRLVQTQRQTQSSVSISGEERSPSCSRHQRAGQSCHHGLKTSCSEIWTWSLYRHESLLEERTLKPAEEPRILQRTCPLSDQTWDRRQDVLFPSENIWTFSLGKISAHPLFFGLVPGQRLWFDLSSCSSLWLTLANKFLYFRKDVVLFHRCVVCSTIVASCILVTTSQRVGALGKLLVWHGARSPAYVETTACFVGLVLLAGTGPHWAVSLKWLSFIRSRRRVCLCFNVPLCLNVYGLQVSHKQTLLRPKRERDGGEVENTNARTPSTIGPPSKTWTRWRSGGKHQRMDSFDYRTSLWVPSEACRSFFVSLNLMSTNVFASL